jgi:transcriptional regulator with XRE-family HTH domain
MTGGTGVEELDMRTKNSQFIKLLKDGLERVGKQSELAKLIGASESRIPEWMKGDRLPSPDTLINLGKLALERGWSDPFFFWALAGVDTQTLRLMADKVQKRQYELLGETVPVPRFRETEHGREEAGPPVPLPVEFIPNLASTSCLVVDEQPSRIRSAPRGLFLVDSSARDAQNLSGLWGKVIFADLALQEKNQGVFPNGIYVGRLLLQPDNVGGWVTDALRRVAIFTLLAGRTYEVALRLGIWSHPSLGKLPTDPQLLARNHMDEFDRLKEETEERAPAELRLDKGVRILAEVIGRLSGQTERK